LCYFHNFRNNYPRIKPPNRRKFGQSGHPGENVLGGNKERRESQKCFRGKKFLSFLITHTFHKTRSFFFSRKKIGEPEKNFLSPDSFDEFPHCSAFIGCVGWQASQAWKMFRLFIYLVSNFTLIFIVR
jgi:hypothetical protein